MNLLFWKKDKRKPSLKENKLRTRMASKEMITCSCGFQYTANHTKCVNCGKKTIQTLLGE